MAKRVRSKRDEIKQHFWLKIKEKRMAAGLSQRELADRSRLHKITVGKYENGFFEPTLQALVQLMAGLDLKSLDELVKVDVDEVKKVIARTLPPPRTKHTRGRPRKPDPITPEQLEIQPVTSEGK